MRLNPEQRKAVDMTEGPLLVFAGAGSGKTMVIIHRIARLLEKGVSPYNILAVTFTNKAAGEMRERVKEIAGPAGMSVWVSTFHSMACRILRYESDEDFTIYDEHDQLVAIKQALKNLNLDKKKVKPSVVRGVISNAKNNLVDPESFLINASARNNPLKSVIGSVYEEYERILRENGGYDFGDLINKTIILLREKPDVLRKYQERFKYIMVDEYQDTNYAQYSLIKLLSPPQNNICVVGDDDQGVYSWRGADIRNILEFEKNFRCSNVLKLEENYRSTKNILKAANNVIENNLSRKNKKLWTQKEGGEEVRWQEFLTAREEAAGTASEIKRLISEEGYTPGDMALFYRVNAQSRQFEDIFRSMGINYRIVGGVRFYERKEIKDILAYMMVVINPDDDISMSRIINRPSRGIGEVTLGKIKTAAAEESKSLYEVIMEGSEFLSDRVEKKIKGLRKIFKKLEKTARSGDAARLARDAIELSGYHRMLEQEDDLMSKSRIENIEELVSAFTEKENREKDIAEILSEISLLTDLDSWEESTDYVTLMTVHLAKGLEFPVVFLTGLEEELFPHRDALSDPAQMEEERRLCYVGMTRAQEILYMTSASQRMLYGQSRWHIPSRFVREGIGDAQQEKTYNYD